MDKVTKLKAPSPRGLFTLPEAARYLTISEGTLRNWVSMRRIAYVKVGSLTRFQQSVLDDYIASQTVEAVRQPKA